MKTEHIYLLWQAGEIAEAVYQATVMSPPGFDLATFIARCERSLSDGISVEEMKARCKSIDLMRECLTAAENVVRLRSAWQRMGVAA